MRAKWRKKRVRRLKRKRRKTRARSKQLATSRSQSPYLASKHHDNVTSAFTPSPASTSTPLSTLQITRTVWDYHSVQWQLGCSGIEQLDDAYSLAFGGMIC
ncbi:hypothetical protein VTL71DRAFT_16206 [Oculimacula yallundae]|uniref:60S ribosomal protein L41 n=1 Tax=Oculimacula yallundae TaxID=86028 RepID=A0ABR4CG43_9HELO